MHIFRRWTVSSKFFPWNQVRFQRWRVFQEYNGLRSISPSMVLSIFRSIMFQIDGSFSHNNLKINRVFTNEREVRSESSFIWRKGIVRPVGTAHINLPWSVFVKANDFCNCTWLFQNNLHSRIQILFIVQNPLQYWCSMDEHASHASAYAYRLYVWRSQCMMILAPSSFQESGIWHIHRVAHTTTGPKRTSHR